MKCKNYCLFIVATAFFSFFCHQTVLSLAVHLVLVSLLLCMKPYHCLPSLMVIAVVWFFLWNNFFQVHILFHIRIQHIGYLLIDFHWSWFLTIDRIKQLWMIETLFFTFLSINYVCIYANVLKCGKPCQMRCVHVYMWIRS